LNIEHPTLNIEVEEIEEADSLRQGTFSQRSVWRRDSTANQREWTRNGKRKRSSRRGAEARRRMSYWLLGERKKGLNRE
jgi:hypothetical protein